MSFINFKQTWYVICSSRKLSFGWCWLCSCTEENSAFRGEDLEAVACISLFKTLFDLQGFTEKTKRSRLWTLSSFVEFFTKWNNWNKFGTFHRQQELHTRSDKWDNLFIKMATAKHTLKAHTDRTRFDNATRICSF